MRKPKISVIIPFYNNYEWTIDAIKSVLMQTFNDFEIILIDDGSKGNIDTYLEEINDNRIKYFRQDNKGPGAARNLGIKKSIGDYLAFLDSDDIYEPEKLKIQIETMEKRNVIWSHTSYIKFSENGKIKMIDTSWFFGRVYPLCLTSNPIATPTVMIKRDVLKKTGFKFAEHLRYGQDGYLWNKLAERFEIIAISKPLTKVRMRGANAMLSARIQLKARALSLERIKTNCNSKRINNNIDGNIIRIYNMCFKLNNFLEKHIYILDISESISELIAKIVYFPLWLCFKIEKHRLLKQNRIL